jgi:ribokinase
MGRVWVVGSLNVDRPWRVERHPEVGETVVGEVLDPVPGGKGLNQAVAAARVGGHVVLVGSVGDDEDGRWLRGVAADEHLDLEHLDAHPTLPTGSALIVVADDGANTVTVAAGANGATAFPDEVLAADDVVCAQLEVPVEAVAAALLAAHEAGARSVLNPSPVGAGVALVPSADVVVVNQHEAAFLAGDGDEVAVDPPGRSPTPQRSARATRRWWSRWAPAGWCRRARRVITWSRASPCTPSTPRAPATASSACWPPRWRTAGTCSQPWSGRTGLLRSP